MTKKIHKINFENDYEFLLIGLISAYKDYKVCFELNQILKLDFQRKEDIFVPAGKPVSTTRHSYFICPGKDGECYHVLSNRDKEGTGYFIPELRNIDYFLLISEAEPNFDISRILQSVRSIGIVSGAFELTPSEIKSAEAFLLFLEA